LRALQEQLRVQVEFGQECRKRACAAPDWRLKSAWTGVFLQASRALAETGFVLGTLEHAGTLAPEVALLLAHLRLPKLPALPKEEEGPPPPPDFRKTTPGRISRQISPLAEAPPKRAKSKGGAPRGRNPARTPPSSRNSGAPSPAMCAPSRPRWRCCAPCCPNGECGLST